MLTKTTTALLSLLSLAVAHPAQLSARADGCAPTYTITNYVNTTTATTEQVSFDLSATWPAQDAASYTCSSPAVTQFDGVTEYGCSPSDWPSVGVTFLVLPIKEGDLEILHQYRCNG